MKVLIVDDEALARERLQRLVEKLRPHAVCRQASSAEEALEVLAEFPAELVLLDVRMPGMGGVELASHLAALDEPPAVIFCTAFDEYALEALRRQAVAYLLKPVASGELEQALSATGRINRAQVAALRAGEDFSPRYVTSEGHRGLESLPVEAVRCFIAEQKYVSAIAPGRELLLADSLRELEAQFGDRFLRVHRNALVAPRHVRRLVRDDSGWCVELAGVEQRPAVSRRHLAQVKERLRAPESP